VRAFAETIQLEAGASTPRAATEPGEALVQGYLDLDMQVGGAITQNPVRLHAGHARLTTDQPG